MMSDYSIPGIAHPIRYTDDIGKNKYLYIDEMLKKYKVLSKKPLFIEGYYQSYKKYYDEKTIKNNILPYVKYANKKADEYKILKTGGIDSHGHSIFK